MDKNLEKEIKRLEAECRVLRDKKVRFENENNNIFNDTLRLKKEIVELSAEVSNLKDEVSKLRAEKDGLGEIIKAENLKIYNEKNLLSVISKEQEKTAKDLEMQRLKNLADKDANIKERENLKSLGKKLTDLKNEVVQKHEDLDRMMKIAEGREKVANKRIAECERLKFECEEKSLCSSLSIKQAEEREGLYNQKIKKAEEDNKILNSLIDEQRRETKDVVDAKTRVLLKESELTKKIEEYNKKIEAFKKTDEALEMKKNEVEILRLRVEKIIKEKGIRDELKKLQEELN